MLKYILQHNKDQTTSSSQFTDKFYSSIGPLCDKRSNKTWFIGVNNIVNHNTITHLYFEIQITTLKQSYYYPRDSKTQQKWRPCQLDSTNHYRHILSEKNMKCNTTKLCRHMQRLKVFLHYGCNARVLRSITKPFAFGRASVHSYAQEFQLLRIRVC